MDININPVNGKPFGEEVKQSRKQAKKEYQDINPVSGETFEPPQSDFIKSISGTTGTREFDISADEFKTFAEKGVGISQLGDYREMRAQRQGAGEKWLNATGKMATIAGTTFIDGTVGTLNGLLQVASTGDITKLWDNEFSRYMADVQSKVEEALPNYLTHAQQNTPWYLRAATGDADFWGDTIFKNFGFAIGALAAGVVTGGASAEVTGSKAMAKNFLKRVGKQLAKSSDETIRAFASKSPDDLAKAIVTGKLDADILGKELLKDATRMKWANAADELVGSLGGAIGEGRIEAIHSSDEYANELIAQGVPVDEARARAKSVGNSVFAANIALLTAGNYTQYRNAFGGGYNPEKRALANLIKGDAAKGYEAVKTSVLGKVGRTLKNPVTEMLEEMNQSVIKKTSENYYNREFDPEATEDTNNFISSLFEGFAETYGSEEGWEEGFAGFITGAVGLPNIVKLAKGEGFTLEGNVISDYRRQVKEEKNAEQHTEILNNILKSEDFVNAYLAHIRDISLQRDKKKALLDDDIKTYKDLETSQWINDANKFIQAGKFDDFIEQMETYKEINGDELREVLKIRKDENGADLTEAIDPNKELSNEDLLEAHSLF